jgi:hypothetical protein
MMRGDMDASLQLASCETRREQKSGIFSGTLCPQGAVLVVLIPLRSSVDATTRAEARAENVNISKRYRRVSGPRHR